MGVSYDRPSATGRRYDSVDPGDELDPRNAVSRCALGPCKAKIRGEVQIGRMIHTPSRAVLLLFQDVEPFARIPGQTCGGKTFAEEPTAGSRIGADDVSRNRGCPV